MKTKLYILGLFTTLIVFLGTLFKVNHWPGAGYLLILGTFMLIFIFLPVALMSNYKAEGNRGNRILYIVTWLTCFVVFAGMLFKIQHWSGAGYAMLIALPFPYIIFLPVFLVVTGRNKNYNIYNTVSVLILLAVISAFSALLAVSVSKERIADSLGLARNYISLENSLKNIPSMNRQEEVYQKIDDILILIDNYKDLIYKYEGITEEEWKNDPEIIMNYRSHKIASSKWFTGDVVAEHSQLQSNLNEFLLLLKKTPGCEKLAPEAPVILNMKENSNNHYIWTDILFKSAVQPWPLIYLDGLEVNLKMIKATL